MNKFVWVDLEMTGLDLMNHKIIEFSCIITDSTADLNVLVEPLTLQINVSDAELAKMDDWNVRHHGVSGLIEKVKASKVSVAEAEGIALKYLIDNGVVEKQSPLCGNSVHMDSAFLMVQMPKFREYLHHRIIDVSSIKVLAQEWYPNLPKFKKSEKHSAAEDIQESISELKYYANNIFKQPGDIIL